MDAAGALALSCALAAAGVSAFHLGKSAERAVSARLSLARGANNGRLPTMAQASESAEKWLRSQIARVPQLRKAMQKARQVMYRRQLRQQLPQAIRLLCIALDSGNSLSKALEYAARNSSGVMAKELRRAVWDIQAGRSFDEAMRDLRLRTGGNEFVCLAVAMEIQHKCGGTLGTILESLSQMLQQTSDLEEELVTKTTQAQLSARVVALMPIVILGLLSLVSPGYLGQFLDTPSGVALLALAVILELVGVVLVKKSLAVDMGIEE